MLRFCDMEIVYVEEDRLDKDELTNYFSGGYCDDFICVVDCKGGYIGRITHDMLNQVENVYDAVMTEHVILNKDVWTNARKWFNLHRQQESTSMLLPVVNERRELVCFAYEDYEANRELRMIKELQERGDSLGYAKIFPEYKCVIINGFNEVKVSQSVGL